jgi:hypothetical protein
MKAWVRAWIVVWVAMAAGMAEAKPPKEFAGNVTYCMNRHLQAQSGGGTQLRSVGRLREDCERLVQGLDSQFRHERAYMRGSIDQRREILSRAIDCEVRWLGRPGTAYQDCVRQALDAMAENESEQ